MIYAVIAARGFAIVLLTALNVVQISRGHYLGAFVVGGAISWTWFGNSRTAAFSEARFARHAYAFGAAVGTLTGMFLGRHIGG